MDLFAYASTLTPSEGDRLAQLETTIEKGLQTFVDVGLALMEIRDGRLYRQSHLTFEEYCRERWGWARNYTNKIISAAETVSNLGTMVPILPATERQARPLTQLEPAQQVEAWQRAVETAPGGKVTAAHVQQVVEEYTLDMDEYDKKHLPFVVKNSGNNEWYTPPQYIEAARRVMGEIDLDPASSVRANETIRAAKYFDIDDNGITQPWSGRVWMNPPYASDLIGAFCGKLLLHVQAGDVIEAIVLVNNATETEWFNALVECASAVVFHKARIRYINPNGGSSAPLQGQAFIYCGDNPDKFLDEFGVFGWGAYVSVR